MLRPRQEEYCDFPLLTCSLYFGFFNVPLLLCFLLSTFGQDHTSGPIVSGLDVTCVLVNRPSTDELPSDGRLFRKLADAIQLSEIKFYFNHFSMNHRHRSLPNGPNWNLFVSRRQCISMGLGRITRQIELFSGRDMVAINEFSRDTPEIFPCFNSVANRFRKVCNSASLLQRATPCALQKTTCRLAQSGGYSNVSKLSTLWCEQYTHKYSTYRVAQHDHISSRVAQELEGSGLHIFVSHHTCHPRVTSHSCRT